MNEYLTTQQLYDELGKRMEHDADVMEELASESNELQEKLDKILDYLQKMEGVTTGEYKQAVKDILHYVKGLL